MNPLDIVLTVFVVLVIIYLIVLAASEPKYTWRNCMTFKERLEELGRAVYELHLAISDKSMPDIKAVGKIRLE